MSEQHFQRDPAINEEQIHEDPLAELARIVAGEEVAVPEPAKPAPPTAQMIREAPAPARVAPVENTATQITTPQTAIADAYLPDENDTGMDLESQLMAELGAQDTPAPHDQSISAAPAPVAVATHIAQVPGAQPAIAPIEEPDFETMLTQQLEQGAGVRRAVPQEPSQPVSGSQPPFEMVDPQLEAISTPQDIVVGGAISADVSAEVPSDEQIVDELDFSAAFDAELGQEDIPPQEAPAYSLVDEIQPEPPASTSTDQTSQFQFQAAPDFSSNEQQIDDSVHDIQEEIVGELNFEDAFSDAFASEISTEMNNQVDQSAVSDVPPVPEMANSVAELPSEIQVPETEPVRAETVPQPNDQLELTAPSQPGENLMEQDEPQVVIEPARTKPGFKIAAISLGLALMAGGIVIGYGMVYDTPEGVEPVLIRADKTEFKVKPEEPGGKKIANLDQPVYDAVAGDKSTAPKQETLITASEEPVNVVRDIAPSRPQKSNVRLVTGDDPVKEKVGVAVMQPRKVKTVTVRADGSIVRAPAADDNLPASLQAALTPEKTDTASSLTSDDGSIDGASTTGLIAVPQVNPNTTKKDIVTALVKQVETVKQQADVRSLAAPVVKSVPVTSVPVVAPVVAPKPVSTSPVTTSAPAPVEGGYVVQISSQRSFEAAEATYKNLKRRFAGLLGDQPKEIREAKVDGKGTFYRVRIPQATKSAALDFCTRYKSAGGSCFVTK